MPQPRQHESQAARQAAYRARQIEQRAEELARKNLPAMPKIAAMPGTARWKALVALAAESLQTVADEMKAYADERSEAWQESERAEEHQTKIEDIEQILQSLEEMQQ
jgi:hypothetical protein